MGMYEFNPDDAMRFAKERGTKVKTRGDELQFEYCPYCHGGKSRDKYTFGIDLKSGRFNCKRASCDVSGNMITLSREFDFDLGTEIDEYYRPRKQFRRLKTPGHKLIPKDPAIQYLMGRGIREAIVRKYEITTQQGTDNILAFPFFDENGILQFAKYRKMDFDKTKDKCKEWCEPNCKPILFGMKQCENFGRLVITEGQIDSLSVASAGIDNAVSVPTGKNGFTWIPYCFNWVTQFDEIVIFGDFENGKMTLLDDLKRRFPNKIRYVREQDYRGCKDANELLQKYGVDAVRNAVKNSELVPVERVIRLADVERVDPYQLPKVRTGIRQLDATLCGGLPFGALSLFYGKRGGGKSTSTGQILVNAVDQGYPVFAYSGEMPNYLFKSWFDRQAAGRSHVEERVLPNGIVDRYVTDPIVDLIDDWDRDLVYLYDNRIIETDEKEDILKTLETAILRYGIKVALIDNLMTAMYIDETPGVNVYDRQGQFVRKLTQLALKYDCAIILVAHKRKNGMSDDANDEVSGSGDITNLAGVTISLDKDQDLEDPENQRRLRVTKNRLFGRLTGDDGIILNFDEKSLRLYGENDGINKKFGWETRDEFIPIGDDGEIPFD